MSVAIENIPTRESSEIAEAPRPAATAKLRGLLGRNVWALADQVLMSGTNFATAALTLRALALDGEAGKKEFGTFSTIYAVLLFANILQSTLVTQPHNVIGVTRDGEDYRRYTSSTAFAQLWMLLIEAALAIVLAIGASHRGHDAAAMMVALIPSIIFWQLQEFVRRVMYTERRFGAAFVNDIISYGGQTVVLAAMYCARLKWNYPFTGAMALYALAWTSAAAFLVGVWQIRHSLHRRADAHGMRENWHFGKWLAGGEVMGYFSSIHMQVIWAAWLLGMAASADLRAAQILFGPTRVIAFFLGTVLPIRFARTLHEHGMKALHHDIRVVYLLLAPMVGVYCGLLAVFPEKLLHLVYGAKYVAGEAALILTLYSICAFLNYMQMVVQAALTATRQTRSIFISSVWGCFIALAASPVFIKRFQGPGAMIGMIVTTIVVTSMLIVAYRKHLASPKERATT